MGKKRVDNTQYSNQATVIPSLEEESLVQMKKEDNNISFRYFFLIAFLNYGCFISNIPSNLTPLKKISLFRDNTHGIL